MHVQCILPGNAVPEMTYTVSGGTLNPTHSLTHSLSKQQARIQGAAEKKWTPKFFRRFLSNVWDFNMKFYTFIY